MKKVIAVFIAVAAVAAIIAAGYAVFAYPGWIYANEPVTPIPLVSAPGKLRLTSDGCCFTATDATVYILDENDSKTVLIEEERVSYRDTYECADIPKIKGKIRIGIDFISDYSETKDVSLIVGEFSSTDTLSVTGLLLSFGDGDLTVRSGLGKKFFRDGVFGQNGESAWYQER